MRLRSIFDAKNLQGKRVLVRCGFDVPLSKNGKIEDESRIKEALPTLRYLQKKKTRIILLTHIGRPSGKRIARLSTKPIAKILSQLLLKKVFFIPEKDINILSKKIARLQEGEIVLLENLRFWRGEKENNPLFAEQIAHLGDMYINEAFSNSHRNDASMVGVPQYIPSYAGFHLEAEVAAIEKFLLHQQHPVVAVIGGVKISSKLGVILRMLRVVDHVILGGALANTVLAAKGISVGKSFIEKEMIARIKAVPLTSRKLHIPVDALMSESMERPKKMRIDAIGDVNKKCFIVDIGPETTKLYQNIIQNARTAFFAGPMGKFEIKAFSQGTFEVLRAAKKVKGYTLAGGGDTMHAIHSAKIESSFDYISSAGGATLQFLEGKTLPALKPLLEK